MTEEEQQQIMSQLQGRQQVAEEESPAAASEEHSTPAVSAFDESDVSTWGTPARNEPCPCGSGKKFKHCHGKVE